MTDMIAIPNSSSIAEIGYNAERSALYVRFNGGKLYRYDDVPPIMFDELKAADSVGKFVNANIKTQYDATPVASTDD